MERTAIPMWLMALTGVMLHSSGPMLTLVAKSRQWPIGRSLGKMGNNCEGEIRQQTNSPPVSEVVPPRSGGRPDAYCSRLVDPSGTDGRDDLSEAERVEQEAADVRHGQGFGAGGGRAVADQDRPVLVPGGGEPMAPSDEARIERHDVEEGTEPQFLPDQPHQDTRLGHGELRVE